MGQPAYRIFSDKEVLKALDYRQRIYYQGAAIEHPLETFLPISISSEDFLSLLSGLIPSEPESARPQSQMNESAKVLTLVYSTKDPKTPGPWRMQLKGPGFSPSDNPELMSLARGPRNNPDFLVIYDKWGKHLKEDTSSMVDFPEIFRATWRGRTPLEIRAAYNEIRLGFTMPPNVMELIQPSGFEMHLISQNNRLKPTGKS
jgi:hypothetical protein